MEGTVDFFALYVSITLGLSAVQASDDTGGGSEK